MRVRGGPITAASDVPGGPFLAGDRDRTRRLTLGGATPTNHGCFTRSNVFRSRFLDVQTVFRCY